MSTDIISWTGAVGTQYKNLLTPSSQLALMSVTCVKPGDDVIGKESPQNPRPVRSFIVTTTSGLTMVWWFQAEATALG